MDSREFEHARLPGDATSVEDLEVVQDLGGVDELEDLASIPPDAFYIALKNALDQLANLSPLNA